MYTDGNNNVMGRMPGRGPIIYDQSKVEADLRARIERDGVMMYAIGFEGVPLERDMKTMASHSGGRAEELKHSDDLAKELAAVVDELHHQYLLGFTPQTFDGQVHKLEVKVKPRGLTVRARATYVAGTSSSRVPGP
jgi:hypothetical protein